MAYRRSYAVKPLTVICLLWTFTGVGAVIGYNLTGSLLRRLVEAAVLLGMKML